MCSLSNSPLPQPIVLPGLSECKCGTVHSASLHLTWSVSHCLTTSPFHPGCPSLPLLPVCLNVSSLTPWLSDFHTVQLSGSSGYCLFFNLLSFFWLCEEAKCMMIPFSDSTSFPQLFILPWPGVLATLDPVIFSLYTHITSLICINLSPLLHS